jgi:mRNA interferase MazF
MLTDASFAKGTLHVDSYVRPRKLFTANEKLIVATVGTLHFHHFEQVIEAVIAIFQTSLSDCSSKA